MATANGLYSERVKDIMNSRSTSDRAFIYKESVRAQKTENKIESLEEQTQVFQAQMLKSSLNSEEYLKKIAKYTKISANDTIGGHIINMVKYGIYTYSILKFMSKNTIFGKKVFDKLETVLGKGRNGGSSINCCCCDENGVGGRFRRTTRRMGRSGSRGSGRTSSRGTTRDNMRTRTPRRSGSAGRAAKAATAGEAARRAATVAKEKAGKIREKAVELRDKKLSQIDTKRVRESAREYASKWTNTTRKTIKGIFEGNSAEIKTAAKSITQTTVKAAKDFAKVGGAASAGVFGSIWETLSNSKIGALGLKYGGKFARGAGVVGGGLMAIDMINKYHRGDALIGNGPGNSPIARGLAAVTDTIDGSMLTAPSNFMMRYMDKSKPGAPKNITQLIYDMFYNLSKSSAVKNFSDRFDDARYNAIGSRNPKVMIGNEIIDILKGQETKNSFMWKILQSDRMREWYYGSNYKEFDPEITKQLKGSNKILKSLDGKSENLLKLTASQERALAEYNDQTIGIPTDQGQYGQLPANVPKASSSGISSDRRGELGTTDTGVGASTGKGVSVQSDTTSTLHRLMDPGVKGDAGTTNYTSSLGKFGPFGNGFMNPEKLPDYSRIDTSGPSLVPNKMLSVRTVNPSQSPALNPETFINPMDNPNVRQEVKDRYSGKRLPVSIRNNNPGAVSIIGNVENSFGAKQPGFVGTSARPKSEGGSYAIYASPEHGVAASAKLIRRYGDKGINTTDDVVKKWSTDSKAWPSYSRTLKKYISEAGFDPNGQLDFNNPKIVEAVMKAQSAHESGAGVPTYVDDVYKRGVDMAFGNQSTSVGVAANTNLMSPNALASVKPDLTAPDLNFNLGGSAGDHSRIVMANEGKTRNRDLQSGLKDQLEYARIQAGLDEVRVTSGGQTSSRDPRKKDKVGGWTGSHRHDDGGAGDLQLVKDGKVVDFTTKEGKELYSKFITASREAGATGIGLGADYMGTKTIHVGGGKEAMWGGAPDWAREAFNKGKEASGSFDMAAWKDKNTVQLAVSKVVTTDLNSMSKEDRLEYYRASAGLGSIFGVSKAQAADGPTDDSLIKLRDNTLAAMDKAGKPYDDTNLLKTRSGAFSARDVITTPKGDRVTSQGMIQDRINSAFYANYGSSRSTVSQQNIQDRIDQAHVQAANSAENIRITDTRPSISDVSKPVTLSPDVDFSQRIPVQNETPPTSNTMNSSNSISPSQVPHYPDPELMYPLLHYNLGG